MAAYYQGQGNWNPNFGRGGGQGFNPGYQGRGGFRRWGSNNSLDFNSGPRGRGRGGNRGNRSKSQTPSMSSEQMKNSLEKQLAKQKKADDVIYNKRKLEIHGEETVKLKTDSKFNILSNVLFTTNTADKVKKNVVDYVLVPVIDKGKIKTDLIVTLRIPLQFVYDREMYNKANLIQTETQKVIFRADTPGIELKVANSAITTEMSTSASEALIADKLDIDGKHNAVFHAREFARRAHEPIFK